MSSISVILTLKQMKKWKLQAVQGLQGNPSQNKHHCELQFKQNLRCNVYVNIKAAEGNCSEISQMQSSGHKMSVILWNRIFNTILGWVKKSSCSWVKE